MAGSRLEQGRKFKSRAETWFSENLFADCKALDKNTVVLCATAIAPSAFKGDP